MTTKDVKKALAAGESFFMRYMRARAGLCSPSGIQPKADLQRLIHPIHGGVVQPSHFFAQPAFIQRADLFQQHNGIAHQPAAVAAGVQLDVRGQPRFVLLAGDGGSDHGGAETIAHIVLHDQHRPDPALLRADDRAEIGVKNIPSVHIHTVVS